MIRRAILKTTIPNAGIAVRSSSTRLLAGVPSIRSIRCSIDSDSIFKCQQQQTERHYPFHQIAWFSDNPTGSSSSTNTAETSPPGDDADTTATATEADDTTGLIQQYKTQVLELQQKVTDLNDKILRGLADQDNTRRIAKRDVDDARQFAIKSFAKGMIEVSDNLDRALHAVPAAMQQDPESHPVLVTLYEGIEMTQTDLAKTFAQNGLQKYCTAPGDVFDPNLHNALFEYGDVEKEPGTIGQVIKCGYLLNQRVLRPAEVGVIKKE